MSALLCEEVMTLSEQQRFIVAQMVAHMWTCKRHRVSYADCMAEARKQFNREVQAQADATPLEEVTGTVPRK